MPPAPTAPLPECWTEEKDSRGRTFFSNHKTRTTTWEVSGQYTGSCELRMSADFGDHSLWG